MIFPPAFLASSNCLNTNHNQLHLQEIGNNTHITTTPSPAGPDDGGGNNSNEGGLMATAGAGRGDHGGVGTEYGHGGSRNSKPMSMSDWARLARVPRPVPGLNCPRCDSINTKFCYFNNYSLTQPRHFCRACRRYWTRGGALRNVPIGGGYRRHAKRMDKPKTASAASQAAATGTSSTTSTTSGSTSCATGTGTAPPGLLYSMFGRGFADSMDPASLGLSFPARLLFGDSGAYTADGCAQHHHDQAHGNRMEQWAAAQIDSFPFVHAIDNQMSRPPTEAMPITMAAMQGMFHFHLGLRSGGGGNGRDGNGASPPYVFARSFKKRFPMAGQPDCHAARAAATTSGCRGGEARSDRQTDGSRSTRGGRWLDERDASLIASYLMGLAHLVSFLLYFFYLFYVGL